MGKEGFGKRIAFERKKPAKIVPLLSFWRITPICLIAAWIICLVV